MIVFDGYDENSTKDMTHVRHSKGKKGVSVTFTADMNLTISKEDFLTNNLNKKQFVSLLSRQLESTGSNMFMAKADADLLIVNKAIEAAETRNTVLVGEDTDLLVLLLHHLLPLENKIYFAPGLKKNATGRVWDIKQIQSDLESFTCKHLLFLHAFLGCDTTSRIYGIGKGSILKKFKDSVCLQQAAIIFNDPNSTHSQVQDAGEKALVAIYGGSRLKI